MSSTDRQNLLSSPAPFAGVEGDLESGAPVQQESILQQSSHPVALIFHLLFRTAALLTYLFGSIFTDNFILIFVLCVLLLSFDFWTVKNVSGRLLVGLRWWNEIKDDGSNVWVFESRDPSRKVNAVDSRIFWWSLYLAPALWLLFALISILKFNFQWLLVVAVALALNAANVVGYTQCDKDAKQRWATGMATSAFASNTGFVGSLAASAFRRFTG